MTRLSVTPLELELVYHVAAEIADGTWRSVQAIGVGVQTRRMDGVYTLGYGSGEARQAIRALCELLAERGVLDRRVKPGGGVQYRKRGGPCPNAHAVTARC